MKGRWDYVPLKRLITAMTRGTAPNYVDDGPVRVIGQAANQISGIDWTRTRFHASDVGASRLKGLLIPGDILVNSTGTGTLGRVGQYAGGPDSRPCIADGHITVVRANTEFAYPRFLYYTLSSQPFYDRIYAEMVVGATNQIELSAEKLSRAPVPLPPFEEQRRIADFLDTQTARLDRLIEARQCQLEALSERTLASITQAFAELDVATETRLGYLARVQSGLTVDGGRELNGDVVTRPYLRVANVQSGYLDLENVTEITVPRRIAATATLRPGDVLMTEGGDLDKLGRGTVWNGQLQGCLHQNHVFAVRPDPTKLLPDYLALYTRSVPARMHFERTGTKTTNLASTSSSKIKDLRTPVVSLDAQRRLCERVAAELAAAEKMTSAISTQVELIAERKQALITAAVTGQFDVTTARGVDVS